MPECDLPHEGGRSQRARAAGGAASKLAGGHAPAQTCPSARTWQPSDGPDHHDEVAAEGRAKIPARGRRGGEQSALLQAPSSANECPTWPGSQLILLGCEVRGQGTQTSQAWCGLQGVLHRDLPGSAGGLASDGIAVRVTRPESHLCANAAPAVWNRARQLCTGWLPPAHAKLRVRSRTTIGRPHPILALHPLTDRPSPLSRRPAMPVKTKIWRDADLELALLGGLSDSKSIARPARDQELHPARQVDLVGGPSSEEPT